MIRFREKEPALPPNMVTMTQDLPGYRIVRNIGVCRGIVVRSRSVFGNALGGFQIFFGGRISVYTHLCERTRADAYAMMCDQARDKGGNAVVMMRYDANEVMNGVTEVICYGSSVWVVPIET